MYRSFLESYVYDSHDTIEKPFVWHSLTHLLCVHRKTYRALASDTKASL